MFYSPYIRYEVSARECHSSCTHVWRLDFTLSRLLTTPVHSTRPFQQCTPLEPPLHNFTGGVRATLSFRLSARQRIYQPQLESFNVKMWWYMGEESVLQGAMMMMMLMTDDSNNGNKSVLLSNSLLRKIMRGLKSVSH